MFDDVEKKTPLDWKTPKQKAEVSDEKSKVGLGEIYEKEYQQQAAEQMGACHGCRSTAMRDTALRSPPS